MIRKRRNKTRRRVDRSQDEGLETQDKYKGQEKKRKQK